MTQALFLDLLKHNLFGPLILIIVVYTFYWFLMLTLGCRILTIKLKLIILTPAVLIMLFYCIVARWYLLPLAYGLILAVLVALLLKIYGGSSCNTLHVLWTSISIILISALGDIFILSPIYLNKKVALFLLNSPFGSAIGGILESVFPLLALIVLPRFKRLFLLQSQKKTDRYEIYGTAAYGLMYCSIYFSYITLYVGALHNANYLFLFLILLWITTIGVILLHHTTVKGLNRRIEIQQQHHEEQQRLNQENMRQLELQNDNLKQIAEELKTKKERPQKVIDSIANVMDYLREYYESLSIQNESDLTLDNDELPSFTFSETESSIIELIIQGKTDKEIGKIIHLSPGRVSNIVTDLLSRTRLSNRTMLAVRYALKKYSEKK